MNHPILQRLEKVRGKGDQYMACCPSHSDRTPSLGIKFLQDGRILIHCLAGCEVGDVLAAIGMTMDDLFPDGGLGQFKGWMQIINGQKEKEKLANQAQVNYDKTLLMVCDADRKSGRKLSKQDLAAELEAFKRMQNENNNG